MDDSTQNAPSNSQSELTRRQLLTRAGLVSTGVAGFGLLGSVPQADAAGMSMTAAEQLRQRMRKLWEDHITWTRLYIVSFAAGLPDLAPTTQRLLRNQVDIGNAIKPFYGAAAGNELTALLKQHILGAAAILTAAKAGNSARVNQTIAAWYANADQIAAFLHRANPPHWPLAGLRRMMRRHLSLTLVEAVDRLHGNYAGDIAAYDRVHREILTMADMLSAGIIAQFPHRFGM